MGVSKNRKGITALVNPYQSAHFFMRDELVELGGGSLFTSNIFHLDTVFQRMVKTSLYSLSQPLPKRAFS